MISVLASFLFCLIAFFIIWFLLYRQIKKSRFNVKLKKDLQEVVDLFNEMAETNISLLENQIKMAEKVIKELQQLDLEKKSPNESSSQLMSQNQFSSDNSFKNKFSSNIQEKTYQSLNQSPRVNIEDNLVLSNIEKVKQYAREGFDKEFIASKLGISENEVELILSIYNK